MKASELTGAQLDYWVAKAENPNAGIHWSDSMKCWWWGENEPYSPSTNWAQGGPIIEREQITIQPWPDDWAALWYGPDAHAIGTTARGRTPLIAAMRAYVASKFGEEVPDTVAVG